MDKLTTTSLNRRLLKNLVDNTTDTAGEEMRLAAADFTCPDRFDREREQLFRRVPQPVAFAA